MAQIEGTGYYVVPDALRKNTEAWQTASNAWNEFLRLGSDYAAMAETDMGLLGMKTGFPRDYNAARETILKTTRLGIEQIDDVRDNLDKVAKEYENRDAEYYERFGYMGDDDANKRF
ncbi:hypothetical protein [Amycolatopsis regifaucium]|uniref:ESX-1 secretion-associated protein n=1 Tax=Amycolatopsis regifaucium TaxID=546365 RepID=A0A154M449_9PSEU|nr:hypothetical protein [Amycolatopsis regifaucium]KZB79395.1 hypothetical protein AVL48_17580 [Amycolatopsis regifaucium]SFH07930.1 hypothetical protein SAMN04489731_102360 [Amycolatopsis regifaucium]